MRFLGGLAALALLHLSACSCGDDDAAIDAAPNADAMETPDAEPADAMPDPPPGPVTDLTATPSGSDVDLTWTNPTDADFAGVIIVRRLAEPSAAAPVDGTSYSANDTLAAGETVVYAGNAEAFSDTAQPPGVMHYAAYAMDAATQWSSPAARAFGLVAAASQTATLTVDLTPAGVVVSQQPANHVLAATVVYDDPGDTITVTLTATNGLARNVFAPKAVVTNVNQGAITGDGDLGGDPFVRLGTGLAPAGMGEGELVFTGIDGTVDPITIDLTIADHPAGVLFGNYLPTFAYELIDSGTGTPMGTADCDALRFAGHVDAQSQGRCAYRSGALSGDGRRLYVGHRSLPLVRAIDPATGTVVMTLSLDAGMGTVRHVALDAAGRVLYASLTLGGHTYADGDGNLVEAATEDHALVAIDTATMTEIGRLVIGDDLPQAEIRLGRAALSPDGTRLALAERNEDTGANIHLVDTATLTLVDTDTATAGVQPIDASTVFTDSLKGAVYTSDGFLVAQDSQSTAVARVDMSTFAVTSIAVAGSGNSGGLFALADGEVAACYGEGTDSFSIIDGTDVTPGAAGLGQCSAVAALGGQLFVATQGPEMLHVYDLPALTEVGTGTALAGSPGHELLFTPF